MVKIKVILGSTRPTRFFTQPGKWLIEFGKDIEGAELELVDLADVSLPFLDEPMPALRGPYQNEHTKQWSKVISDADGFVFVTPEYNHSYTPVLKNAIDYLYQEWKHKPVAFVSYGSAAGGSRAVEHLRSIAGYLSMYDITEHVMLPDYFMHMDDNHQYKFTELHEQAAKTMLESLIFWAERMKPAREELVTK